MRLNLIIVLMRSKGNIYQPKVYVTDHMHSRVVCGNVAVGCKGQIVPTNELLPGPAVTWGVLRGAGEIIKKAIWCGKAFFHIDHGYFLRGHYNGYYRVTPNGLSVTNAFTDPAYTDFSDTRWLRIKDRVVYKPLNRNGRNILVCGPSSYFADNFPWLKLNADGWVQEVVKELASWTDRPIIARQKTDNVKFSEAIQDAFCVVVHSTNAALEAMQHGVPAIALGPSLCDVLGWGYTSLETPEYSHFEAVRHRLFSVLANYQFTLEELRTRAPWEKLGLMEREHG
jgi:hypothetical protein